MWKKMQAFHPGAKPAATVPLVTQASEIHGTWPVALSWARLAEPSLDTHPVFDKHSFPQLLPIHTRSLSVLIMGVPL
jgi:hypothetical protein